MVTLKAPHLLEDCVHVITDYAAQAGQDLVQASKVLGQRALTRLRTIANELGLTQVRCDVLLSLQPPLDSLHLQQLTSLESRSLFLELRSQHQ
jgi:hypothetical protein